MSIKKGGLKGLGDLIFQLAFKSEQFSSFYWLQKSTKFDPNDAKMAIKNQKIAQRLNTQTPVCDTRE